MPAFNIRDLPEEVLRSLEAHAAAAGLSREAWIRFVLTKIADAPVVRKGYRLRACTGQAQVELRRHEEKAHTWQQNLSVPQRSIVKRARALVERNLPGDREEAIVLLGREFEDVLELP